MGARMGARMGAHMHTPHTYNTPQEISVKLGQDAVNQLLRSLVHWLVNGSVAQQCLAWGGVHQRPLVSHSHH